MRRTIWLSVLAIAVILAGAGSAPRWTPHVPAWSAAAGGAAQRAAGWLGDQASRRWPRIEAAAATAAAASTRSVAAAIEQAKPALAWRAYVLSTTTPRPRVGDLTAAVALGTTGIVLLIVVSRRRRPHRPRRRVIELARRGRPTAWIARRTRLAQDAVRVLLQPEPSALETSPRARKVFPDERKLHPVGGVLADRPRAVNRLRRA